MTRFNHLHVPDQWRTYFTRYPQGYTILEALFQWIKQVDDMVDNQNELNKTVEDYRVELDDFVAQFNTNLQGTVEDTLSEWQQSGFLDVVIDQALQTQMDNLEDRVDDSLNSFSEDLAQTEEKTIKYSNAELPLNIRTYDGYNQPTHPSALYFENGLYGFKYWLGYTPFPFSNDLYENPSIAVSNDGISWQDFPGLENPLDSVTEEENNNGIYLSDIKLVYTGSTLEVWYRWYNNQTQAEALYRRTTNDGVNWTQKEMVYNRESGSQRMLSPSVIYDGGKYRMWFVSASPLRVLYTESENLTSWSPLTEIPLAYKEETREPWHIDVFKEASNVYHIIINEYTPLPQSRDIMWGTSTDGMAFNNITTIMQTPKDESAWDSRYLYHASLAKVGNTYKLFYSSAGNRSDGQSPRWGIGLAEGESLTSLTGAKNINGLGKKIFGRIESTDIVTPRVTTDNIIMQTQEDKPYIKMVQTGVSGAGLKTSTRTNTLQVVNDSGDGVGSLEVGFFYLTQLRALASTIEIIDSTRFLATPFFKNGLYLDRESEETENPQLNFRKIGSHAAAITNDENRVLRIKDASQNISGHLQVATVIFGNTDREVEGSIRYNTSTKKHQGYDGTTWNDLY